MDDLSTTQVIPQADYPIDTGRTLEEAVKAAPRRELRQRIETEVADIPSLLGTTADGAIAGIIIDSIFVLAMRDAAESSLKTQFKTRINALFGGDEMGFDRLATRCDQYISDIQSGVIKVPFLEKYGSLLPVFDDVSLRNTQVADAVAEMIVLEGICRNEPQA